MLQITLMVAGKEMTYRAAGMNLGASLTAYELYKEYGEAGGEYSAELMEKCVQFTCEIFGKAFSREQLLSGYHGSAFILFPALLREAVGYVESEVVNFPQPPKAAEGDQTAAMG